MSDVLTALWIEPPGAVISRLYIIFGTVMAGILIALKVLRIT
jgi:hypothetical protein